MLGIMLILEALFVSAFRNKYLTYPMSEIVCEGKVSSKGIRKCMVEVKNFQKAIPFDNMKVTVGECPYVRCRLSKYSLFPELITKYVTFT